ncbi:uncharacterized protein BO88DRAFT_274821 [Aspergillus vadensis CBS 113365]|uniref:Uncharacterized protein n=1 Tax=Aspergillus vadensis (strain CBS 113365 / IMI 142717 / IBT 24658) TaxID=1448311 RepID=A0A319BBM2_ASPVC|nr:hypothetical protein BO88DRAFT_274821 [Aspergillus vadensis CBS 113365]PYH70095.1 hypothetical protein BO88DRAFT_274821 [Aspergillus vadensis CBS 113365]
MVIHTGLSLPLHLPLSAPCPGVGRTRPSDLAISGIRRQRTARGVVESWTWIASKFMVPGLDLHILQSMEYLRCTEYSVTDLVQHGRWPLLSYEQSTIRFYSPRFEYRRVADTHLPTFMLHNWRSHQVGLDEACQ